MKEKINKLNAKICDFLEQNINYSEITVDWGYPQTKINIVQKTEETKTELFLILALNSDDFIAHTRSMDLKDPSSNPFTEISKGLIEEVRRVVVLETQQVFGDEPPVDNVK